ncbi:acyltransferase [Hymenobacter sp. GOD-10R]|uniref:acyltransferase n=1 Tax=Hymenobacter sp. GOD-10R TaxID=3093922 RepID=UPI002D769489|nr:acyltransferase [Hymenobacter sp. GOD-10R]WRQ27466.1 acyltransferase [Hymenobacter sp. GOD-10R]
MSKVSSRNYAVDVFRLLGALSVVALHVPYADLSNSLVLGIRWWGRWAVPFFFLLSGYFFQKNYAARGEVQFVRTIKNLLAIYIISNLIYLVAALVEENKYFYQLLDFYTLDNGISEHLWFIGSMLFGYLILLYLLERFSDKLLIIGSVALYITVVLADAYSGFFHTQFDHGFIRYFVSIPFLLWGFMAAKKAEYIKRLPLVLIYILLPVSFLLQAIEIILIYRKSGFSPHNQEFVLLTLLFAVVVFALALKLTTNRDTILARFGRQYSLLIYLYHPLLNLLLFRFVDLASLGGGYLMLRNPILSFVFCLVIFIIIDRFFPAVIRVLSGG